MTLSTVQTLILSVTLLIFLVSLECPIRFLQMPKL